jgi:hypothetical protein
MLIPFQNMPGQSRIWIYQANTQLSKSAQGHVLEFLEKQIQSWNSHGADMKASATILNDQFVVIAADESYQIPSGCSIDKSVNWMRELSNALKVDFFDRSISYLQEGEVVSIPLSKLKKTIEANIIQPETVVFNHTITTLAELEKFWMVPAKDSWISRYFTLSKV